jgi:RNA polymerase sigma factor for flagellar operon FliA
MSNAAPAFLESTVNCTEPKPSPQELWQRYHQTADPVVENQLIHQYLPLVKVVVGRLAMSLPPHVDYDDLHSAGLVGLLQAVRHYDPTCRTTFEGYARVRIRGAVFDELRRMDWVPRSVHEKARRIQETMSRLEQELGRAPTDIQMAKALNLTLDEYSRCLDEIRPATYVCLDSTSQSSNGDTTTLYDIMPDSAMAEPWESVSHRELSAVIAERVKELPEIQRKVLALYYEEDMLLREIAEAFGLTESRICQIHSQAILAIKGYVAKYEAGATSPRPASRTHA